MIVGQGQPLGVGLEETELTVGAGPTGLGLADDQHFVTEIRPDDAGRARGWPQVGQRQVPRAGTQVEDRAVARGGTRRTVRHRQ